MVSTDEKTLERARALVRRSCIAPSEYGTIRRAALALLANGRQLGYDDMQIIRFCRGLYGRPNWHEEERTPPAPTPYDQEILELEEKVAAAKAEYEEADRQLWAKARAWAKLTGQDGWRGGGITMTGLRAGEPRDATLEAGKDWSIKPPKPPDRAKAEAAEAEIHAAARRRGERQEDWQRVQAKLTAAKAAASRWRATETYRRK